MKKIYYSLAMALAFPSLLLAQPVNDNCAGALDIVIDGPPVIADNTDATVTGTIASCFFEQTAGDVWYTFTTSEVMSLIISTEAGSSSDSNLSIFSIEDCGGENESYTEIDCNEDIDWSNYMSEITLTNLDPGTYYIKAGTYNAGTAGSYNISIESFTPPDPPVNDFCETAIEITVDGDVVTADNTGATVTGNNGTCFFGEQEAGDSWFTFTTTEIMNIMISTEAGSSTDSQLVLFTINGCGTEEEEYTEIACDDDGGEGFMSSIITFDLAPGTYYIKAGTYDVMSIGDYEISVVSVLTPENDDCAGAVELIVDGPAGMADNTVASISGPEASCNLTAQVVGDTWFSFTTTEVMNIQVNSEAGTSNDSQIAVFTIDGCGTESEVFEEIGCDDDGGEGFMSTILLVGLEPGTYYIKAGTYGSGSTGSYSVSVVDYGDIPVNDSCEGAVVQTLETDGPTVTVTGSGTNATDLSGLGIAQVWEAFTIDNCSDVTIDMCGTPVVPTNYFISVTPNCPLSEESVFIDAIFNNTDSCGDGNMTATFLGLEAGTYYYPVMSSPEYTVLDEYTLNFTAVTCAPEPDTCLFYANEEYTFFAGVGGAPSPDENGVCETRALTFGAWASESYLIENFAADVTYTFSICDGPAAGAWESAISVTDPNGNVVAYAEDCSVTWITEVGGTYVIGVNELNHCYDSQFTGTDNGIPTLSCMGTVGIEEVDNAHFSIFPNPNNGQFSIRNAGLSGNYTVEMIDLSGRTIHKQTSVLSQNSVTDINPDKVAAGTYLIKMINNKDKSSLTKRIVVQ